MKNLFNVVVQFVEDKFQIESKKKQLRAQVVKTGEAVFLKHVMPAVESIVRQLIVEKGLNPDYVPPPPAPPKVEKHRPAWTAPHGPKWLSAAIKNKDYSQHPVIVSRRKLAEEGGLRDKYWERQQAEAAATMEQPLQVAASSEEVTEIGGDAIDNLRSFMKEFDKLVLEQKPAKAKKNSRKKASKKTASRVTKNFGGYFRRVSEE